MSARGYAIAGAIVLVLLAVIYACLRTSGRAEDEEQKWREEHHERDL